MNKKTFLSFFVAASLSSVSYANNLVALIINQAPSNYVVGLSSPSPSPAPDPTSIKELSCTWGECLGVFHSNQTFYLSFHTPTTDLSGFTNTTNLFVSSTYLFLEDSGVYYSRGRNNTGSLGLSATIGTPSSIETLTPVVGLSGSVQKILPGSVTIAQTSAGLYFAGENEISSGTPIDSTRTTGQNYNTFNQFVSSTTINDIAISGSSFAYVDNGEVFVLGENNKSLFGVGVDDHSDYFSSYQKVPDLTGVSEVYIGKSTSTRGSMFVLKNGTIWASGEGDGIEEGKLGLGDGVTNVNVFTDTGFAITELNMLSSSSTTYVIKDNKLYYSGKNELSGNGERSSEFILLEETKDMNFKNFVTNGEYKVQILRDDGKIIRAFSGPGGMEIIDLPLFSA